MMRPTTIASLAAAAFSLFAAQAGAVTFSAASATFAQSFDAAWMAAKAIDGSITNAAGDGWAIFDNTNAATSSQTALFTLQTPLAAGAYTLTYTLSQIYGTNHVLDTFSLAYTTAAGPVLASAQTLVSISSATSSAGAILTASGGNIDASGTLPATDIYTIVASINAGAPVTGLFLNAIDNAGVGPGRQANGNFVLTEFQVSAAPVPEPAQLVMLAVGLVAVNLAAKRRNR